MEHFNEYIHDFFFLLLFVSVVKDLKYADTHEWVKVNGSSATIGITDHAQDHLGDVVYVELPEVGVDVKQGGSFGAVESVKATSDINSPVSGKVVEVNEKLSDSPGLVCFLKFLVLKILKQKTIASLCCTLLLELNSFAFKYFCDIHKWKSILDLDGKINKKA